MTYEEAINKVVKCLRLAKSSNPHEAALAAARAQEIMDKYSITSVAAEFEQAPKPDEPIHNFDREPVLEACQKDRQWSMQLAMAVGEANGCKCWRMDRSGGVNLYLVGRASDVATARYLIGLLAGEVRRLNREHCQGYSDKYRRDFKYGVVDAIKFKLATQWNKSKQEVRAENTGMALVRVDQAIMKLEQRIATVSDWMKNNMKLKDGSRSNYKTYDNARAHGRQAGATIEISRAKGGLGAGSKAIQN